MKMQYIIIVFLLVISIGCGKEDNYPAPDGGIKGELINADTQEPFETEQPNGVRVRMLDIKYGADVSPIDIWTKADGSFETTQLFNNASYKVVPLEGAFFNTDTATVAINGITNVSFVVTPFLTITMDATKVGNDIIVNYKLSRSRVGNKISQCKTILSAYPTVSNTINEMAIQHDLSGIDDAEVLAKSYSDTLKNVQTGTSYYIRVAGRTENANNKYNYSKIVKIDM